MRNISQKSVLRAFYFLLEGYLYIFLDRKLDNIIYIQMKIKRKLYKFCLKSEGQYLLE